MSDFIVKPLTPETWPQFANLAGKHNGTLSQFEQQGFQRDRKSGKNHWVVKKLIGKNGENRLSY